MFPSVMSSLKCCSICYAEAAAGDVSISVHFTRMDMSQNKQQDPQPTEFRHVKELTIKYLTYCRHELALVCEILCVSPPNDGKQFPWGI